MNASHDLPSELNEPATLVIRLSSLGDVIQASSALSVLDGPVDWVVAREFAGVLRGHPSIRHLWEFDRSEGLRGWWRLCRQLKARGYAQALDLHGSLRSRLARWFFRILPGPSVPWRRIRKYRFRLTGFYIFKKAWPRRWLPPAKVAEFSRVAGGSDRGRPDLTFLARTPEARAALELAREQTSPQGDYYCVMPASRWSSKQWPVRRYVELIQTLSQSQPQLGRPVILGTGKDGASRELVALLRAEGLPFVDGVGRWTLSEAAGVLSAAKAYLGSDTGLAHLSEALGVRAWVIFGPTVPEMGFGPWREESVSVGKDLWCRPCGKDGRNCHRISQRHACLKELKAHEVLASLEGARR